MATDPSRRVLVVDDDDDIRLLLHELLIGRRLPRGDGSWTGARRSASSIENPTDLVVLDLSMPELDGFETLDRLRDLSDVPVILLTARSGEIEKVRGFRAGADDYVVSRSVGRSCSLGSKRCSRRETEVDASETAMTTMRSRSTTPRAL